MQSLSPSSSLLCDFLAADLVCLAIGLESGAMAWFTSALYCFSGVFGVPVVSKGKSN